MLKYVIIFFWCSNTFAQVAGKHNIADTVTVKARDTLHLYFPLKETGKDSTGNAASLDTFTNVWYSRMLKAMKEPVLPETEGDTQIYRFTWLRTFHRPITIRIQRSNDSVTLIAKILSGAGGYDPGQIITDTAFVLTPEKWETLQAKIGLINFWRLPVDTDSDGMDGAEWILEGVTKNNYHFVSRWSPGKNTAYGQCCLYFLSLSGIKIPEKEIY